MAFDPPDYLDAIALEEWKRLLPYMEDNEYNLPEYVQTYAMYCRAVQTVSECKDIIDQEGHLIEHKREGTQRNPVSMTQNQAWQTLIAVSKLFGFSPKDKKDIAQEKTKEGNTDEFTQYGV